MSARSPEPRLWTLAELPTAEALLAAARKLRESGYAQVDTHSPYPLHHGSEALGLGRSPVPLLALAGGLAGASTLYGVMYYMNAVAFPLNVGNRPPHAPPAFVPITFEAGVLLCALFIFFGLLFLTRLPQPYHAVFEHDAFRSASTGGFWISVAWTPATLDAEEVEAALRKLGGTNVATVREEES